MPKLAFFSNGINQNVWLKQSISLVCEQEGSNNKATYFALQGMAVLFTLWQYPYADPPSFVL